MTIVLNGDTGLIVSGNTNTLAGVTVGQGASAVATNTAVGASALAANTTGATNVAFGASALASNTTASNNTAVGYQAAYSNTTGATITAVGRQALYANSTGANNVAVGNSALYANTTGTNNISVGDYANGQNTTGSYNVAIGRSALDANTTASNNTAVGYQAGYTNVTGAGNTFIGHQAGYTSAVSGNAYNTCIGVSAGNNLTTGVSNTFIGTSATASSSGGLITTGSKNTIIGAYSGNQGGLDIRTASNYIVLSDGDGNPALYWQGAYWAIGNYTGASTNQYLRVNHTTGSTSGSTFVGFTYNSTFIGDVAQVGTSTVIYNTTSDYRLKNVIGVVSGQGERIDALEPIEYEWKTDGSRTRGFLAHKFQEVYANSVSGVKDALDADGNPKYQAMQASTSEVIADLVAEIQSLRKRLAAAGI